jgi:hypothetical protein
MRNLLLCLFSLAVLAVGCTDRPGFAGNWAIQGQDAAIKGCPHQYRQVANVEGRAYVIGCWGHK